MPFSPLFLGEGSPTKIDYTKKLVPTCSSLSILEDLGGKRRTFRHLCLANPCWGRLRIHLLTFYQSK